MSLQQAILEEDSAESYESSSEEIPDDDSYLFYLYKEKGDERAFQLLVETYTPLALSIAARHGIDNAHDREDVVADAWMNLINRSDNFSFTQKFRHYFTSVVRNTALDAIRRSDRRISLKSVPDLDAFFSTTSEDSPLPETVEYFIEQLDSKFADTLRLRLAGYSVVDIAGILHRKDATIRWRLAEARKKLEKLFQKYENVIDDRYL